MSQFNFLKDFNLPVYRTTYGLEQRAAFKHPDRYEEEVEEFCLDNCLKDFKKVECKNDSNYTSLMSFLVVGDQNAGKSTFLHTFCDETNRNFMKLSSFLPIVSSSFVNSRFMLFSDINKELSNLSVINENQAEKTNMIEEHSTEHDSAVPKSKSMKYLQTEIPSGESVTEKILNMSCDEPPFLDTDIARGLFLLTIDDFLFFANEFNIPVKLSDNNQDIYATCPESFPALNFSINTKYVGFHLIELGGDHLDRLALYLNDLDYEEVMMKKDFCEYFASTDCMINPENVSLCKEAIPETATPQLSVNSNKSKNTEESLLKSNNNLSTSLTTPFLNFRRHLDFVLQRSLSLISDSQKIVYYVNCESLFRYVENDSFTKLILNYESFMATLGRFRCLSKCIYPRQCELLIFCSRLPETSGNCDIFNTDILKHIMREQNYIIKSFEAFTPIVFDWKESYNVAVEAIGKFTNNSESRIKMERLLSESNVMKLNKEENVEENISPKAENLEEIDWNPFEEDWSAEDVQHSKEISEKLRKSCVFLFIERLFCSLWKTGDALFCKSLRLLKVYPTELLTTQESVITKKFVWSGQGMEKGVDNNNKSQDNEVLHIRIKKQESILTETIYEDKDFLLFNKNYVLEKGSKRKPCQKNNLQINVSEIIRIIAFLLKHKINECDLFKKSCEFKITDEKKAVHDLNNSESVTSSEVLHASAIITPGISSLNLTKNYPTGDLGAILLRYVVMASIQQRKFSEHNFIEHKHCFFPSKYADIHVWLSTVYFKNYIKSLEENGEEMNNNVFDEKAIFCGKEEVLGVPADMLDVPAVTLVKMWPDISLALVESGICIPFYSFFSTSLPLIRLEIVFNFQEETELQNEKKPQFHDKCYNKMRKRLVFQPSELIQIRERPKCDSKILAIRFPLNHGIFQYVTETLLQISYTRIPSSFWATAHHNITTSATLPPNHNVEFDHPSLCSSEKIPCSAVLEYSACYSLYLSILKQITYELSCIVKPFIAPQHQECSKHFTKDTNLEDKLSSYCCCSSHLDAKEYGASVHRLMQYGGDIVQFVNLVCKDLSTKEQQPKSFFTSPIFYELQNNYITIAVKKLPKDKTFVDNAYSLTLQLNTQLKELLPHELKVTKETLLKGIDSMWHTARNQQYLKHIEYKESTELSRNIENALNNIKCEGIALSASIH